MIGEAVGLAVFLFLYGKVSYQFVRMIGYGIGEFRCFVSQQIYLNFNQRICVDPTLIKANLRSSACSIFQQMTAKAKGLEGPCVNRTLLD
jgi:hypothetical protein